MPLEMHGQQTADRGRFAVVASRFNEFVTAKLLAGAVEALKRHGAADENITIVHVPGAFEISVVAKHLAESLDYDAIICLGCVIRGETPHFEYVAGEAARGIAQVALSTGVPTTFGVITADNTEQALARASNEPNNKGVEAALAAMELVNLFNQFRSKAASEHEKLLARAQNAARLRGPKRTRHKD